MAPSTMKQWTITSTEKDFDGLEYGDVSVPKVGDNDVLVKINGASLNYRDLIIPKGQYPFPVSTPVAACSDGAGEVVEIGSRVTRFKPGDKVVTLFNQAHHFGPVNPAAAASGLGGMLDGTLRQYGTFNETGLAHAPTNLRAEEAATLTCAGLTAWNALYGLKPLLPGQWVLVQGTGGVSLFGLQFAKAAGAKVIATTSSADKVEKLKELGADHVINYREDKNWGTTAKKLTPGGEGVDHIIEVGGAGTLEQSCAAIRFEGVVSIIGFLGGAKPRTTVLEALLKICTFRGVYVGSRSMLEDMCRAIEANDIHPVLDPKVFSLDQAKQAYQYMWDQGHFGKVALKIE
ncbi:hypothetical protein BD289DRAFT_364697 [Coniella lustricola]|uniref:Enoyl reductase (ER) domain-containing protein n=1 Tax=Coniella lustricola TaxID=2025994 RepID=A0A2T3ADM7_9PEZI|nr:hypothetical protein BD289DRAFT_364697 [Coniella lustricola]